MKIIIPVIIVAVIGFIVELGLSLAGKYLSDDPADLPSVPNTEIPDTEKVAFVACSGDCYKASTKYAYSGLASCAAAAELYDGPMDCASGCIGLGDCANVCEYGGIEIADGVARIDDRICNACGKCVNVCPKKVITVIPKGNNLKVRCINTDKGGKTMKVCDAGCIGCSKCVNVCSHDAIKVENFVAKIDGEKCTGCGECISVCPRSCIAK